MPGLLSLILIFRIFPWSNHLYLANIPLLKEFSCFLFSTEVPPGVAMHPCSGDVLEMKRLYVNPYFQGLSIGRKLAEKLIELARSSGFSFIKLDTVATMTSEIALYNSPGFREIPPHCSNPVPGAFLPWN